MSQILTEDQLRASLGRRLQQARSSTDSLFALLDSKAMTARPIPERHRIIFYLGHFETFDWNLLGRSTFGLDPWHEEFDQLFAFGIDPVDGNLPTDGPSDWPSLSEIKAYNQRVRQTVDCLLEDAVFDRSPNPDYRTRFNVAIEHRLMHAETLAYILHWLPLDQKKKPANVDHPDTSTRRGPHVVEIPAGLATLGLSKQSDQFGWDNEFDQMEVSVPGFSIDAFNVTNGQYLEFLEAGGYEDPSLWSTDGWNWVSENNVRHPRFWKRQGKGWGQLTMFDVRPLPLSWPVYVSHSEATAYARWSGKALPTEAQLHRAAYATRDGREQPYPWGSELPDHRRGNFDSYRWNPTPVGSFPAGNSAFGVSDLLGNGWEWTSTVFEPFDGFERFEFYPGYSTNFFDGRHFVIKGGSSRTSACMLRRSFRNWFQPNYPHIYATFRCVEQ